MHTTCQIDKCGRPISAKGHGTCKIHTSSISAGSLATRKNHITTEIMILWQLGYGWGQIAQAIPCTESKVLGVLKASFGFVPHIATPPNQSYPPELKGLQNRGGGTPK